MDDLRLKAIDAIEICSFLTEISNELDRMDLDVI